MSAASALIGALIGALAGVVTTWIAAKRQDRLELLRWKREDITRFHDLRRDLYARFMALATSAYRKAGQRTAMQRVQTTNQLAFGQVARLSAEIEQAATQATEVLEQINLVAAEPVKKAAGSIAATLLVWQMAAYLPPDYEGLQQATKDFLEQHQKQFYMAARAELGIDAALAELP